MTAQRRDGATFARKRRAGFAACAERRAARSGA